MKKSHKIRNSIVKYNFSSCESYLFSRFPSDVGGIKMGGWDGPMAKSWAQELERKI
jgi:hypothetical protein